VNVNPGLVDLLRPVNELTPDPHPIRDHPDSQIKAIAESLSTFGQQKPIVVDNEGHVLAGNGTLLAAKRLGWAEIACRTFVGTPDQARAFRLADNRTGEFSEWDPAHLDTLVADLDGEDRAAIGFTDQQLVGLLQQGGTWQPEAVRDGGLDKKAGQLALTAGEWRNLEPVLIAVKAARGAPDATWGQALTWLCETWLSDDKEPR
jgi:hypothetical protein